MTREAQVKQCKVKWIKVSLQWTKFISWWLYSAIYLWWIGLWGLIFMTEHRYINTCTRYMRWLIHSKKYWEEGRSHKFPTNFLLAKIGGFPGSKIFKKFDANNLI